MNEFLEDYLRLFEALINSYRILLAIEEGKSSIELINTERGLNNKEVDE